MASKGSALIPAPTRYVFGVLDTSPFGFLAYANRFQVIVLDIREKPFLHVIFEFPNERVSCLAFCKHRSTGHLAVGGEDGMLRIWNVETRPVAVHSFTVSKMRLNSVKWKPGSDYAGFVCSDRYIYEWDLLKKTISQLRFSQPIRDEVTILDCCPTEPNILAAGFKKGSVTIYDTCNGKIIHQLFHRDQSIIYLSWSPHSSSQLLSCACDGNVFVWTLSKNPSYEIFVDSAFKKDNKNLWMRSWKATIWHPIMPDHILISTFSGEIAVHRTTGPPHKKVLSGDGSHVRMVYYMVPSAFQKEIMVSFGNDCQVLFWDLNLKKCIFKMYLVNNSVRNLEFSPIEEGRLMIGSSDYSIRLWDVASEKEYSVKILHSVSKTRITYVSWHPEHSEVIAFGTEEGRIGLFNVDRAKHGFFFNTTKHKGTIYSLSWGPYSGFSDLEYKRRKTNICLYSCGGNTIFINHPGNVDKDDVSGLDFDSVIDSGDSEDACKSLNRTEVSWKKDYSMLAVGNEEGIVHVYNGEHLRLLGVLHGSRKTVNCLRWHPQYTSISESKCSMHNWLACGTAESDIYVYDLAVLSEFANGKKTAPMIIKEPTRVLKGHSDRISNVAWSCHVAGRLASASQDHTVQIWDVLTGYPIVNFQGHVGRVHAVAWSALDPDIVYSGGDDTLVLKWRISEQVEVRPPGGEVKPRKRKKRHQQNQKASNDGEAVTDDNKQNTVPSGDGNMEEIQGAIASQNMDSVSTINEMTEDQEKTPVDMNANEDDEIVVKTTKKKDKQIKSKKSFFPNFSATFNKKESLILEQIIEFVDILAGDKRDMGKLVEGVLTPFGYFGTQATALAAFDADTVRLTGGTSQVSMHAIWKGDVGKHLREAADKEQLNDFHLAVAPMVSRSLWLELCDKYVTQLTKAECFYKAASLLIILHRVYEAIRYVENYIGIKEAFLLARIRLPDSDPVLKELLEKWCKKCIASDSPIFAALCYLMENQPESAANVLFRKPPAAYARLASYISLKYGLIKDSKYYALQCLKRCICRDEGDIASSLVVNDPDLEGFQMLVDITESISSHLLKVKSDGNYGLVVDVLPSGNVAYILETQIWKSYTVDGESYLHYLLSSLVSENFLQGIDVATVMERIRALLIQEERNYHVREVMFLISLNVMACLCSLWVAVTDEDIINSFQYVGDILSACLKRRLMTEFKAFCVMFFPFDVFWQGSDGIWDGTLRLKAVVAKTGPEWLQTVMAKFSERICSLFNKYEEKFRLDTVNHFVVCDGFVSRAGVFENLISTNSIDTLLGFFGMNLIECTWEQIILKGVNWKCRNRPDDSLLNKLENGTVENVMPVEQGSVLESCTTSDLGASDSTSDVASTRQSEMTVVDFDGIAENATEPSAAGDAVNGACGDELVPIQDHSYCDDLSELLFHILFLFSGFSCRTAFCLEGTLKYLKDKADGDLLKLKIGTKLESASLKASSSVEKTLESIQPAVSENVSVTDDSKSDNLQHHTDHVCNGVTTVDVESAEAKSDAQNNVATDIHVDSITSSVQNPCSAMKDSGAEIHDGMASNEKHFSADDVPTLVSAAVIDEATCSNEKDGAHADTALGSEGEIAVDNSSSPSEIGVPDITCSKDLDSLHATTSLANGKEHGIVNGAAPAIIAVQDGTDEETSSKVVNGSDVPSVSDADNAAIMELSSLQMSASLTELESLIKGIAKMQAKLEEFAKIQNFPDGMIASKEIKDLCDHIAEKVSCPFLKPNLMSLSQEIEMWITKFRASVERLVLSQD